jgi:glycerol-3-phosphate dehydrogenase
MFHGGLRYLEQLEFGLVREALHERELSLTTLAPHLVKPLPFLFPLTHRWWERPYVAAGILLYDQVGGAKSVPAQKHLTRAGALRLSPGLRRSSLIGGIRYHDTVVDDARHTMTVARTAAQYGAVVRSSSQVVSLLREGDRVTGVTIRDSEDGAIAEVHGHVVVNATGVWTDEIQALSGAGGSVCGPPRVYTSWYPATGSSARSRSSCAPRSRCCWSYRGAPTGSLAPPTRTGTSTWPTQRPPRPTSTTSSGT